MISGESRNLEADLSGHQVFLPPHAFVQAGPWSSVVHSTRVEWAAAGSKGWVLMSSWWASKELNGEREGEECDVCLIPHLRTSSTHTWPNHFCSEVLGAEETHLLGRMVSQSIGAGRRNFRDPTISFCKSGTGGQRGKASFHRCLGQKAGKWVSRVP